jgi:ribonuclease P protein component
LKFARRDRVRRRADFVAAYEQGTRIHGRYSTLFLRPNDQPSGRLGIAATKKLGGAVQRNRAKRLIREVFRRNNIAPGYDVIVVPKRELLQVSLTVLETEYRAILARHTRRPR